jgi:fatty-acyl-CoA synthase
VDDEDYGKRLRAFVVLEDGAEVSEDDLKAFVKQNLARYKVPREIVFLDELPRNETGKVLKRKLAEDEDDSGDDSGDSDEANEQDEKSDHSEKETSDAS